jgi:uncharacterized membrane protein YdjX (TVP38/TMEM64 family)
VNINKHPSNWQKWIKIILIVVFFILIIIFNKYFDLSLVQTYIKEHPHLSVVVSLIVYFLSAFTFIPSSPLTVFLSLLNGPTLAIILSVCGNTLAALLQYYIGTTITDLNNFEEMKNKLPSFLRNLPINSPLFLLVGRLIPGGTRGLSIICGFYHVRLNTFLWTTFLMYLISGAFIAFGGPELINLF